MCTTEHMRVYNDIEYTHCFTQTLSTLTVSHRHYNNLRCATHEQDQEDGILSCPTAVPPSLWTCKLFTLRLTIPQWLLPRLVRAGGGVRREVMPADLYACGHFRSTCVQHASFAALPPPRPLSTLFSAPVGLPACHCQSISLCGNLNACEPCAQDSMRGGT